MDEGEALKKLSVLLAQGDFEDTIKQCSEILEQDPKFARAYGFRALANFELLLSILPKALSDLTLKAISLKATKSKKEKEKIVKVMIADWEDVFVKGRHFAQDLKTALDYDRSIFLDFDIQSTTELKKHWEEGITEFLKGALDVIDSTSEDITGHYRRSLETLNKKMKILFDKLDNPPDDIVVPENFLAESGLKIQDFDEEEDDIQMIDFGEAMIRVDDLDKSIVSSDVIAKSQHIVAFTINSALEGEKKKKGVLGDSPLSAGKDDVKPAAKKARKKKAAKKILESPGKKKSDSDKPVAIKQSQRKTQEPKKESKRKAAKKPAAKKKTPAKKKIEAKKKLTESVAEDPTVISPSNAGELEITFADYQKLEYETDIRGESTKTPKPDVHAQSYAINLEDSEIVSEIPKGLSKSKAASKRKSEQKMDEFDDPVIAAAENFGRSKKTSLSDIETKTAVPGKHVVEIERGEKSRPSELLREGTILEYKDEAEFSKNPKLLRKIRYEFDQFCKNTKGHPYPDLNNLITPKSLYRRYLYIAEFKFLKQKRNVDWRDKVYEGEKIQGKGFNRQAFDKWSHTSEKHDYKAGSYTLPIKESYTFINWPVCGGETLIVCNRCKGTGRITCKKCQGMGAYPPGSDKGSSPCPECAGAGSLVCPDCNKEGVTSCDNCDGNGRLLHYLELNTKQEPVICEMIYPAEFKPVDSPSSKLKTRYQKVLFAQEFEGIPKFEQINKLFPRILQDSVLKLISERTRSIQETEDNKFFSTSLKIFEIELYYFEYIANLSVENEKEIFNADFVAPDLKVYPRVDPYNIMISGLRSEASYCISRGKLFRARKLLKKLKSLVENDEHAILLQKEIKRKAIRDYRILILPAFILSMLILIFLPNITLISETFKHVILFFTPVFLVTFIISLIMRRLLLLFPGSILGRLILLTMLSTISSVGILKLTNSIF